MSFRSGFVALMGSPNVGKSTLMNTMIGTKVAIVTPRAQTTRNKVTGILTTKNYQIVFLDTPGLHTPKNKLGEYMVKTAYEAGRDVDVTVMVVDPTVGILARDEAVLQRLLLKGRLLAVINKIDAAGEAKIRAAREKLEQMGVQDICEISALERRGIAELTRRILAYLPEGPKYYPEDMITDRPERFVAMELIREKALTNLNEEVPHGVGVEIEQIEETERITNVSAVIYCERQSHKGIIIGKQGRMLKKIGKEARADLEMLFGTKVFLSLWVKVKEDWRNSAGMLKTLGYRD